MISWFGGPWCVRSATSAGIGRVSLLLLAFHVSAALAQEPAPRNDAFLVSLSGASSVALVSAASGAVIARFDVPDGPHELRVAASGDRAFVAIPGPSAARPGRRLAVLNLRTRTTETSHQLTGCDQPHDVRIGPDDALVWVACAAEQGVFELDGRTLAVRRTWNTGLDGGWFVEATPDGRKLYVPHLEGKALTVVDRGTGRVGRVYAGGAQSGIGVAPDGREIWVVDHERQRLAIVSTSSDAVVARIPLDSAGFGRLAFTPDGTQVVLVQGRRLTVFDARRHRGTGAVELPFAGKVIAASPDGSRAAVSHPAHGKVSIVDLATGGVRSIDVGAQPDGVAWVR